MTEIYCITLSRDDCEPADIYFTNKSVATSFAVALSSMYKIKGIENIDMELTMIDTIETLQDALEFSEKIYKQSFKDDETNPIDIK